MMGCISTDDFVRECQLSAELFSLSGGQWFAFCFGQEGQREDGHQVDEAEQHGDGAVAAQAGDEQAADKGTQCGDEAAEIEHGAQRGGADGGGE